VAHDDDDDDDDDDAFLKQMKIEYMYSVWFYCVSYNYLANDAVLIKITKNYFIQLH
jgi:hypothetical protein